MLENWLAPTFTESTTGHALATTLGSRLSIHREGTGMPSLKDASIAIIGLDDSAEQLRESLYPLAWHFGDLVGADLGNIRKQNDHFISQALRELIEGGVTPIILGGADARPVPQFLAHRDVRRYSNVAIVSEGIPYNMYDNSDELFVNQLLPKYGKRIFNMGFLGFQSHFCPPELGRWIYDSKYDGVRLGEIKRHIEQAEPIIRDADMFLFSLNALKGPECPGVGRVTPSGLSAEEACQLSHYAGMSDKLGSFSISGFCPEKDVRGITAQVVAQMVWYFINGFRMRVRDFPVSNTNMTEYVVDYKNLDYQLTFWKSNKSSRWWIQIPLKRERHMGRHKLIPCSYQDYRMACAGELPERLMLALERFA